jgi:hypothetical protein
LSTTATANIKIPDVRATKDNPDILLNSPKTEIWGSRYTQLNGEFTQRFALVLFLGGQILLFVPVQL